MKRTMSWVALLGGLGTATFALFVGGDACKAWVAPSRSPRGFHELTMASLRKSARAELQRKRRQDEAPISLTATDGTGLSLLSLKARAAVEGPLALTELRLTFANPREKTIEGRFEITLPAGASISRFAMRLSGGWQEAEVVERQAARQVYESYLQVRRDPALLEKKAGRTFRARVFPIPAHGVKKIVVSYTQELTASTPAYRLKLRGLPKLRHLAITLVLGSAKSARGRSNLGGTEIASRIVRVTKHHYRPVSDFVATVPRGRDGLRHGNLVVARVTPSFPGLIEADPLNGLAVLVDTSASRAVGLAAELETLQALVRELSQRYGSQVPLQVAAFDQEIAPIYRGSLGGFGRAARERLLRRRGLGASNIHAALSWARGLSGVDRLLLVTDGIATAGPSKTADLRKAAKRLGPAIRRLDVILAGGSPNDQAMRRLVTGTRRRDGVVLDAETSAGELATRLGQATVSGVELTIPGARWVWPHRLDGIQAGQTTLVYADMPNLAAGAMLPVALSGKLSQRLALHLQEAPRPLLEHEWVRARIARLEERRDMIEGATRATELGNLRKKIIALSTRYRVLSDATAMIVLESEAEYRRFHISRRALADVLTVGIGGVQVLQRQGVHVPSGLMPARSIADLFGRNTALGGKADEASRALLGGDAEGSDFGIGGLGVTGGRTIGAGTLGTIGKGGGAGRSRSFGLGGSTLAVPLGAPGQGITRSATRPQRRRWRARVALVGVAQAQVRGALDKAIIRRIIRRHLNELRYCYERELLSKPRLQGKVVTRFVIAPSGKVLKSFIKMSTLGNAAAERCIAGAIRRWRFPQPRGGGIVIVNYPFVLRRGKLHGAGSLAPGWPRLRRSPSLRQAQKPKTRTKAERDELTFQSIAQLTARGRRRAAVARALRWQAKDPTHMLALIALGQALQATGQRRLAARAYGSLIDLYPSRAAMRRYAAERLETLGSRGLSLAVDSYTKALAQRPDHVTAYRLLAWAQFRSGESSSAFATLEAALRRSYPSWRNQTGWRRVLKEDLGLIAAAWRRVEPSRAQEIAQRLEKVGATLSTTPSMRCVLSWETDANDVDLHVYDARGGHAYYSVPKLLSGGRLYKDVTNGYGPEVFAIPGEARAYPYRLAVKYFSRGAMGYGFGTVQVIRHDGAGRLSFEPRPFVVLGSSETVDLGTVKGPKGPKRATR